jgi:hypothetical protein
MHVLAQPAIAEWQWKHIRMHSITGSSLAVYAHAPAMQQHTPLGSMAACSCLRVCDQGPPRAQAAAWGCRLVCVYTTGQRCQGPLQHVAESRTRSHCFGCHCLVCWLQLTWWGRPHTLHSVQQHTPLCSLSVQTPNVAHCWKRCGVCAAAAAVRHACASRSRYPASQLMGWSR